MIGYNISKSYLEYDLPGWGVFSLYQGDKTRYVKNFPYGGKVYLMLITNKKSSKLDLIYLRLNNPISEIIEPMSYQVMSCQPTVVIENGHSDIFKVDFKHEPSYLYVTDASLLLTKKVLPEW